MKHLVIILGVIGVGVAIAIALRGHAAKSPAHVPGEALVQFQSTVSEARANELIAQAGSVAKQRIDPQRIYVVDCPPPLTAEAAVERFRRMPEVAYAELNGIYEPSASDWWRPAEAWAAETTLGAGAPVKVAVIDTAIDATHPALAGKVVQGFNFTNNTTNTQSSGVGQDWHGTASTGRILDGAGDANVQIMPVQVFGSSGGASWSTIIRAINYAVDNGAQIINMSLGGMSGSPLVQQAIDRAVEKGILVVASAGNHGTSAPAYPAAMNGVISVAATNEGGRKANFSAYGNTIDIAAPGDTMRLLSHGGTRMSRGTSFSAPFITGMLTMLKSAFPWLTAVQAEQVMKDKAKANSYDPRYAGQLGVGLLNALDVTKWMAEIRAGTFQFPWGAPAAPPGIGAPQPVPVPPAQPWLVRGRGHSGNYLVTPAGDVVPETGS